MGRVETYRSALRGLPSSEAWQPYLLAESGLPGPRANLELLAAVVEEASDEQLRRWASLSAEDAPGGSREEFLALCGAAGLGRLILDGQTREIETLRSLAADPRWRVREGVAIALQRVGREDMHRLLAIIEPWLRGDPWQQRAAVAALCEPALLRDGAVASRVLRALDTVTRSLLDRSDRSDPAVRTLRQALAYGWSVAVAALPAEGKATLERWLESSDPDVRWLLRENLRKQRLKRMDADWVERSLARLG